MFEKKSRRRQKQEYYRRNREFVKEKSKEYYRRNTESVKASNRRYYLKNSMRLKEQSRRNYRDKRVSRRRVGQEVDKKDSLDDISEKSDIGVDGMRCAMVSGHSAQEHGTSGQSSGVIGGWVKDGDEKGEEEVWSLPGLVDGNSVGREVSSRVDAI